MTIEEMNREIADIFHDLSPEERMKAMRNTMNKVAREIRNIAVKDLTSMSYQTKPRFKGGKPGRGRRAASLKDNIIATPYRRSIGFHVTVASRSASRGGHTKVDHLNRYWQWKPAARWFNTGTDKQEARPFMDAAENALDRYEARIQEVFEDKVNKVFEKYHG